MARIDRLRVSGWMPFSGTHEIDLPSGPIAVVARYAGNPRRSNWAGKTALIEAITWCLFGTHRKRFDDGVINRACDTCEVQVCLGRITVNRSRKRGSATVLTVTTTKGEARRGEAAQQLIVEHLGETLDDYEATVSFRQDDVESIVGMRAGQRREVISTWLRLERWALAGKKAADGLRGAHQELAETRAAVNALGQVNDDVTEEAVRAAERVADDLAEQHSRVVEQIYGLPDPDELEGKLVSLARLRESVRVMRERLASKPALEAQWRDAKKRADAALVLKAAAEKRTGELRSVHDGFDGKCPITCEACPVAGDVVDKVKRSKQLFDEVKVQLDDAWRAHGHAEGEVARLDDLLEAMDRSVGAYNAQLDHGKKLAKEVGKLTMADVESARQKLPDLHQRRADLRNQATAAEMEHRSLEARLAASARYRDTKAKLIALLGEHEAEVRIWARAARALAPIGVPARIARAHVERLQLAANELLEGTGLNVEFAWERPTKDLAPTCAQCGYVYRGQRDKQCPGCAAPRGPKMSDELEILVDDGSGEVEDVRAKSGGAKVLVASALRLSAAAMLREVRGAQVAWATIDEPFGPLDTELREGLARVFSSMLGAVGLEQAFVVSHDQALLDQLPHRIVIERAGDSSTIRLEAT